jgi:hypothetical protein
MNASLKKSWAWSYAPLEFLSAMTAPAAVLATASSAGKPAVTPHPPTLTELVASLPGARDNLSQRFDPASIYSRQLRALAGVSFWT